MQIDFEKVNIEFIDDLDLDDIVGGRAVPCAGF